MFVVVVVVEPAVAAVRLIDPERFNGRSLKKWQAMVSQMKTNFITIKMTTRIKPSLSKLTSRIFDKKSLAAVP